MYSFSCTVLPLCVRHVPEQYSQASDQVPACGKLGNLKVDLLILVAPWTGAKQQDTQLSYSKQHLSASVHLSHECCAPALQHPVWLSTSSLLQMIPSSSVT
mmetsp:Transcript_18907/g.52967  ORF Transcript_18907/g.52967 Transcript_18907/m.52967 type:complete len:101 (-) Transcript_18907:316-618(-)